jgi:hypothetical protein
MLGNPNGAAHQFENRVLSRLKGKQSSFYNARTHINDLGLNDRRRFAQNQMTSDCFARTGIYFHTPEEDSQDLK